MMLFQTMKRIVMDKGAHRPVIGDRFAGKTDQPSELHPLVFTIERRSYLIHDVVISMVVR